MALARQFALDVQEVSRRGPGIWARRLGRRWTLPAALALCGALSVAFLSRLWIIDVGMLDQSGGEAPIFLALEQLGYGPGDAPKPNRSPAIGPVYPGAAP